MTAYTNTLCDGKVHRIKSMEWGGSLIVRWNERTPVRWRIDCRRNQTVIAWWIRNTRRPMTAYTNTLCDGKGHRIKQWSGAAVWSSDGTKEHLSGGELIVAATRLLSPGGYGIPEGQ